MPFPRKSSSILADRFLELFASHNIPNSQIPRLISQIRYRDLDSPPKLLAALDPATIDTAAQLFGIRSEWLEGLDDILYQVAWSRGAPRNLLTCLNDTVALRGKEHNHFPLRVLTTSMNLDRQGKHQQWLLPVIVETVAELGDTLVHRCHIFGNHYDWTDEKARLELKALAWVVFHQLGKPVSLYQVTPREMEQCMLGQLVPSVLWRKGWLSEPSLEDYALSVQESMKAKETDEQAKLLAYLDASGLKEWRLEATPLPSKTDAPEPAKPEETKDAPPTIPEKPAPRTPAASGKRQTQQANWDAILTAAKTIWAENPSVTYADMIERLQAMPHLRTPGESAIHKKLRDIAPDSVRGKPGRKPKYSA